MKLLVEHAREILGMPPEWGGYQFEAIGRSSVSTQAKLLRVKGAVAPLTTKGKNKGRPNWRKADKATEREAFFTPAEHDEWCRQWEIRTGNCSQCMGKGEVFARWHVTEGTTYKPCKACDATGKAHND
ncbi:MAG: hypothetical protein NDI84_02780 [Steroidobacteraceae bacterium]|nr:hypothetical protein [Steroidobacteraceae bacterium]